MDKTKVKIDLMNATQATDKLEAAIAAYDHKQIGAQLYRLRQALYSLRVDLGIVRDLEDLKSEAEQFPNLRKYPKQCPTCGELKTEEIYCTKCGTWIPDEP